MHTRGHVIERFLGLGLSLSQASFLYASDAYGLQVYTSNGSRGCRLLIVTGRGVVCYLSCCGLEDLRLRLKPALPPPSEGLLGLLSMISDLPKGSSKKRAWQPIIVWKPERKGRRLTQPVGPHRKLGGVLLAASSKTHTASVITTGSVVRAP